MESRDLCTRSVHTRSTSWDAGVPYAKTSYEDAFAVACQIMSAVVQRKAETSISLACAHILAGVTIDLQHELKTIRLFLHRN